MGVIGCHSAANYTLSNPSRASLRSGLAAALDGAGNRQWSEKRGRIIKIAGFRWYGTETPEPRTAKADGPALTFKVEAHSNFAVSCVSLASGVPSLLPLMPSLRSLCASRRSVSWPWRCLPDGQFQRAPGIFDLRPEGSASAQDSNLGLGFHLSRKVLFHTLAARCTMWRCGKPVRPRCGVPNASRDSRRKSASQGRHSGGEHSARSLQKESPATPHYSQLSNVRLPSRQRLATDRCRSQSQIRA